MLALLLATSLAPAPSSAQLVSPSSPCTEEERKEAEEDHSRCIETVQARQQVFQARPASQLVALCQRLEEQVNGCGDKLAKCLTAADLRYSGALTLTTRKFCFLEITLLTEFRLSEFHCIFCALSHKPETTQLLN